MEPPAGDPPEPGGIEENGLETETKETENMKMYPEALEQIKPPDAAENTTPGVKDDKAPSGNSPNSSKSGSSTKSTRGSKSFWESCSSWICVLVVIAFVYVAFVSLRISKDDYFSPIREVWKNKNYNILKPIGKGMFSTVYLAMTLNWQLRAVKAIEIGDDRTTEAVARQEADYIKELRHENVVGYYDCWEESVEKQRTFYIAMEYCKRGTLRAALSKLALEQVTKIETGLTKGLDYIHDKGIAHRDIKSDNILVAWDGTPKYADFGLAKRLNATTKRTDMNGLKTILGEVQRHLTNASGQISTFTRMKEFIEPKISNTLGSVSQLGAGMQKLFI